MASRRLVSEPMLRADCLTAQDVNAETDKGLRQNANTMLHSIPYRRAMAKLNAHQKNERQGRRDPNPPSTHKKDGL